MALVTDSRGGMERRPDPAGVSAVGFPAEWGEVPPVAQRRSWILDNIAKGREVERRTGQRPAWLTPEVR